MVEAQLPKLDMVSLHAVIGGGQCFVWLGVRGRELLRQGVPCRATVQSDCNVSHKLQERGALWHQPVAVVRHHLVFACCQAQSLQWHCSSG
jgi:hypothetical protein